MRSPAVNNGVRNKKKYRGKILRQTQSCCKSLICLQDQDQDSGMQYQDQELNWQDQDQDCICTRVRF